MSEVVRERAKNLLVQSAMLADVKRDGRVDRAIPIAHPDGELYGWFVPVAVGEQIAGFFRFLADSTLLGYSEFSSSARTKLACWTDADKIRDMAEAYLRQRRKAGNPVLTYDGVPARIAWRVPFPVSGRTVYVAGTAIYEASRNPATPST